ncbi:MAG: aminodeoxychorismate synthase component I [Candidatus Omnitrophica bacterium]|nr:aminodeoxychorismate synthase component I [Candidatus Omnitrophota bacterium]
MSIKPLIEEIHTSLSSTGLFRLFKDRPYPFFLDSGMDPQKLGRYSFLGFDPFMIVRSKGNDIEVIEKGAIRRFKGSPFYILKDFMERFKTDTEDTSIPFTGGAVGYFSYDLCHHLEDVPSTAIDDLKLPDCAVMFYDTVIISDHLKDKTYIASCGFPEADEEKRDERARMRLKGIKDDIGSAGIIQMRMERDLFKDVKIESNFEKHEYISAIERAKDYIAKGDIYQVNLSQRFSCDIDIPPATLFERLRSVNPAPFSSYLDLGDLQIVSASPERFLCKRGRKIHTRPIKGTRPRGIDGIEDERYRIELLSSIKDRAEHLMIVDLERNDLGRVCEYGTVLPTEFIMLETYSTVFHLVSTVGGILRADVDAIDCLMSCFPGGSITGAPKIRSMEIIDELEPTKRSVYTGSIGYIGFDGDMDTSIVIRTFIIKAKRAYFQVGGGIVADSSPEMEYQETLDKAKALVEALGGMHSYEDICK